MLKQLWAHLCQVTILLGLTLSVAAVAHAGQTTYYHTDGLGSVVMESNEAGQVTYSREYRPYGDQALGTPKDGPGFTGHVADVETGLTYMQQRYYDPGIGRFLSVDPVAANPNNGASFNRFRYSDNNPYKYIDPDGKQSKFPYPVYINPQSVPSRVQAENAKRSAENYAAKAAVKMAPKSLVAEGGGTGVAGTGVLSAAAKANVGLVIPLKSHVPNILYGTADAMIALNGISKSTASANTSTNQFAFGRAWDVGPSIGMSNSVSQQEVMGNQTSFELITPIASGNFSYSSDGFWSITGWPGGAGFGFARFEVESVPIPFLTNAVGKYK